jgi:hypothetical protein
MEMNHAMETILGEMAETDIDETWRTEDADRKCTWRRRWAEPTGSLPGIFPIAIDKRSRSKGMAAIPATVQFESLNFFREVNWRWRRAQRIVNADLPISRSRDDTETILAARFLSALARCRTDKGRAHVEKTYLALHAAKRLNEADGPALWEIKARILADQTDDEIAAHCGLSPETVRWFEALHFCVRDRLQVPDWIAKVLGPGLRNGFTREEMGHIWMALAYHGGPLILEVVMAATLPSHKRVRRTAKKYPAACLRGADLLVKAMMVPANTPLHRIAGLRANVRRLELSSDSKGNAKSVFRRAERILRSLDTDHLKTPNNASLL